MPIPAASRQVLEKRMTFEITSVETAYKGWGKLLIANIRLPDGRVDHVVSGSSMPGISSARMDLYLATYSETGRVGAGGGLAEEHEDITVVEMKLAELAAMADAGQLTDMKTMLLVQTLRLRRP